jgi:hypothetical protein
MNARTTGKQRAAWRGWMLKKKLVTVTTWKFRIIALLVIASLLYATYPAPLVAIGRSLVHQEKLEPADLILLENFDSDYSVFAAGENLVREGYSSRVLVPVQATEQTAVETGFAEVLSRVVGIEKYEVLPVRYSEPISLNVARQIADFAATEGVRSIIVVSPRFRSARSYLVYRSIFTPRGIRVQGLAADSSRSPGDWWHSWHGVQDIGLEYGKLLYYRLWVLRFGAGLRHI